jgi:uncharacterized protein (TIGR02646 family)
VIPVKPAPKPKTFDEQVRKPGLRAIDEMLGKAPRYPRTKGRPFKPCAKRAADIPAAQLPTYWTRAIDDLMRAYHSVCAYSCFHIHAVTGAASVDHFAAKSRAPSKVYEWSNYRLCCSKMNARKRDFSDVIDPFKVEPNSFQLELAFFQVIPNRTLSAAKQKEIQDTIDRLGLDRFREARQADAEKYWNGDVSLKLLREESPFVAYELYRQGRLKAGDEWS